MSVSIKQMHSCFHLSVHSCHTRSQLQYTSLHHSVSAAPHWSSGWDKSVFFSSPGCCSCWSQESRSFQTGCQTNYTHQCLVSPVFMCFHEIKTNTGSSETTCLSVSYQSQPGCVTSSLIGQPQRSVTARWVCVCVCYSNMAVRLVCVWEGTELNTQLIRTKSLWLHEYLLHFCWHIENKVSQP